MTDRCTTYRNLSCTNWRDGEPLCETCYLCIVRRPPVLGGDEGLATQGAALIRDALNEALSTID